MAGSFGSWSGGCEASSAEVGVVGGRLTVTRARHAGVELLAPDGAPLMAPWLGRLSSDVVVISGRQVDLGADPSVERDDRGRPLHGIADPSVDWVVSGSDDDRVALGAVFDARASFPAAHRLDVVVRCHTDGVTVTTTLTATGEVPVPVAFGWHPYLAAPTSPVEVYLPFRIRHRLVDVLPVGTSDDVPPAWLRDPVMDDHWTAAVGDVARVRSAGGPGQAASEVRVAFDAGFGWAMTWVPGSDVGFVCVEPMAGPLDPFTDGAPTPVVDPGSSWTAGFTLSGAPLAS